jgi:hypothetical protein
VAYGGYLLLLLFLGLWLIRRQRDTLVLFNMNPTQFAGLLQDVLGSLKLDYSAAVGRVAFADGPLVLDIETSYVWNNVVLNWHGDNRALRTRIEQELHHTLAQTESEPNPSGLLLTMMAAALLMFIVFAAAVSGLVWGVF